MQHETKAAAETMEPSAQVVNLQNLEGMSGSGSRLLNGNLSIISGVKVNLEVIVGSAELTVAELFALQSGSVVTLNQLRDAPLSVRLDGKVIAQGKLVIVDQNFGLCISEILPAPSRSGSE